MENSELNRSLVNTLILSFVIVLTSLFVYKEIENTLIKNTNEIVHNQRISECASATYAKDPNFVSMATNSSLNYYAYWLHCKEKFSILIENEILITDE